MKNDNFDMKWLEQQMYGNEIPSRKWYNTCKNRNDEICRDWEFESIYSWMEIDNDKTAAEYKRMINVDKKNMGLGGINIVCSKTV